MPYGPAHVIRTGESTFVERVSPDVVKRVSEQYAQYGTVLKMLVGGSTISVPLRGREKVIGALTLGRDAALPP